ncbi:C1QL4-like protein [Mya arenaria]|uniref:C1QL4-like protein n=1 Tax=Mya arenaria TaxID=6604 RepID=A0ABY7GEE6_MYAAR|nr:uncharacterized protein LOC128223872 [Mya arenaria]WAR31321.1 C1QL4-like protein [Mya arenaria]
MYSVKYIREFFVMVLMIESTVCDMNEPRCYSRFDYEEKMLEKMVRAEIKNEELLGKLEALEKRLTNVETEVNTSKMEIQGQEKKHDTDIEKSVNAFQDLEKAYNCLQIEFEKFENRTKLNFDGHEKSLEEHDQRLDVMVKNMTDSLHHPPVAFFATMSSVIASSSSRQTIVFNNVVTDVGGGYNSGTGVFIVPVDGLYVFSTTVMVDLSTSTTHAIFNIKKNGNDVVSLIVQDRDDNYETVSGTVILSLQVGDTVKVTCNDSGRNIYDRYTFVSGFKL